jgi:type VII secretion protein EccB
MPSRRDQVEAYSFAASRLRSALVRAEPDAPRPPLRRTPVGLIIGVVLALLVLGGVALLALVRPGSAPGWRQPGVLIIEKETGNRYVMADGRLHPVLNYASARLLLPEEFKTVPASAKDLAEVPHGGLIGIAGAPDVLPRPGGGYTWLVCATSTTAVDGRITPQVTVLLDDATRPARGGSVGALVTGPDGTSYLVHRGTRMKITAGWVIPALGYAAVPLIPVSAGWLDTVPSGPDLGPLVVPGRGASGAGSGRVGQILVATPPGSAEQYYLVTTDGLVPINETAAALALGDPQTQLAYGEAAVRAIRIDLSALSRERVLDASSVAQPPDLPRNLPSWTGQAPCLHLQAGAETLDYALVTKPAESVQAAPVEEHATVAGPNVAAGFAAPPGGGALVRTMPAPGAAGIGLYLVVETGAKYPLLDDAAAAALGYAPAAAVPVPATVLALLPTGPELRVLGGDG